MTRRQQLIAGGLAAITLILGVTLILNQKNDKKPQVLGEVVTTTEPPTTVGIPGLSNSTTTTSVVVTTQSIVTSTTLAPPTTKATIQSTLLQPSGDITLNTDNAASITLSEGKQTGAASSEIIVNGAVTLVDFPTSASLKSDSVVSVNLSILNKTGKTLTLHDGVVNLKIVSNDNATTIVPVNLGAQSTIVSKERVSINVLVSLPANGTFTFTASANGTWQ